MRSRPNARQMSDKGETSSLFLNEEKAVQMRRRPPVPQTQMGSPHLRSGDKYKRKPAVEWAKAIFICVAFVSSFLTFAMYRRSLHLQRKSADFKKLDKCDITTYPSWKIGELEEMNMSGCDNVNLPNDTKFWSRFTSLKKIDLGNSTLSDLPDEMRVLKSLEILFLSENEFSKIPGVVQHLSNLRVLSLRGNRLKGISAQYLPTSIVWLILTNNQISHIHSNIGDAKLLRKLMLSHNKLTSLPDELGECKDLELIRLADNNIESIPNEVLTLPKLAWISLSGNPIASKLPKNAEKIIRESDIQMLPEVLGSGASGVVKKAKYNGKDVAVKIFKQQNKGSDGNAADEASINGLIDHPLAVSAIGVIEEDGVYKGMVMDLLNGTYPLGKVPSFDTVTRDEGPAPHSKNLSMDQVLSVVWNIASALDYIHTTIGISHSDVYLHNVLRDSQFTSRLSDFGASFVYNRENTEQADIIERIEVLAFGRLVQDLFQWHLNIKMPDSTETTSPYKRIGKGKVILEKGPLYDLMSQILQPDQASRPNFHMIMEKLESIPDFSRISKQ